MTGRAVELDGDDIGRSRIDDCAVSWTQANLRDVFHRVGGIDICFAARAKSDGLVKRVSLSRKNKSRRISALAAYPVEVRERRPLCVGNV